MARSCASGPTKGTVAGRPAARGVRRMAGSMGQFPPAPQEAAQAVGWAHRSPAT